jgi:hypothetical protein
MNGTHQLSAYAEKVDIVGENIDTMRENTEALLDARKEAGLKVDLQNTKHMYYCCQSLTR